MVERLTFAVLGTPPADTNLYIADSDPGKPVPREFYSDSYWVEDDD